MQNEPNFHPGKNEPNPIYKKGLRKFYTPSDNEKRTQNEPNSNPIFLWTNPMQPSLSQRLMKITHPGPLKKTNPKRSQNEPNSNPIPFPYRTLKSSPKTGTHKISTERNLQPAGNKFHTCPNQLTGNLLLFSTAWLIIGTLRRLFLAFFWVSAIKDRVLVCLWSGCQYDF